MEAIAKQWGMSEGLSVREQVLQYQRATGTSTEAISQQTSKSRSVLSKYLNDKYDGDTAELELELTTYLAKQTVQPFPARPAPPPKPALLESRDAKQIMGVCQGCQEYAGMGIVVGRSGYGKTHALKTYAKLDKVAYLECDDTMGSRDLVEAIEDVLGIPHRAGSICKRTNGIVNFLSVNPGYLLIIDEADKLINKFTHKKMEILRKLYDKSTVGIVIAGEPKLELQLEQYDGRMANRMDFYTTLGGLSGKEVEAYLAGYQVDAAALGELKKRARNPRNGCFRLLDRTMRNVRRIMEKNGQTEITLSLIEQASNLMML